MAAGPSSVDEMPEEEKNYLVLSHLTTKVGIKAVRTFFDRIVPPASLASFLNSNRNTLQKLPQRMYPAQLRLLFPEVGTITSADCDITFMLGLIGNTFNVTLPTTGWDNIPNHTDMKDEHDIARIKYYNNNFLAHLQSAELSNPIISIMFFVTAGTVTSLDFDVTLMVCLIRHTFRVTPPSTGWDALPNSTDLTEEADIVRIKYYRNSFLPHLQSAELSNVEFNKTSTDVREVLFTDDVIPS